MMFKDYYKNKKILITGHTGFKGAWLALWLTELGARVTGYALAPEDDRPSLYGLTSLESRLDSKIADIRDFEKLHNIFKKTEPEIVFHLAAQPLVRRSYREPLETFSTNVLGTAHVLEAARLTESVKVCVNVTSDKCYENLERAKAYNEDDRMGGHDPYSASKGCAELVTTSYRKSFLLADGTMALASARAGNVIGGGDWAEDRLIPDMLRAVQKNTPVEIRNPTAYRPWQHVLEPLRGYMMLAFHLAHSKDAYAKAWNFGPANQQTLTVQELAQMILKNWGRLDLLQIKPDQGPHEAQALSLDSQRANKILGWHPLLSVEETLNYTVDWYRAYLDDPKTALKTTLKQIRTYGDLI